MTLVKLVKKGLPVASVALIAACGSSSAPRTESAQQGELQSAGASSSQSSDPQNASASSAAAGDAQTASVSLQLDFGGSSVRICGARSTEADPKYRCFSDLNHALLPDFNEPIVTPANSDTSNCPCFTFAAAGPGDAMHGVVAAFFATPDPLNTDTPAALPTDATGLSLVPNLCPTADLGVDGNPGQWDFSYAIYSDGFCGGDGGQILNTAGNTDNVVCFDPLGLAVPGEVLANETIETLQTGENANHVLCTSAAEAP